MDKIFESLKADERNKIKKEKQPASINPMLATLTKKYFSDDQWIYERKLDGERCLVYKKGKTVKLVSRNDKKINGQYPEIEAAFSKQDKDFIVDGEIVTFDKNKTSFSKLQRRMHRKKPDLSIRVWYYAFDIIHLEEYNLRKLSLRDRKSLLRKALKYNAEVIRYMNHRNREGEKYLKEACQKKWEGLIAKDAESNYISSRSKKWLKFKCANSQELVIGGYTDPQGERKKFGALLVGFYENGKLVYAGKVGTGYDDETLRMLHDKMSSVETEKSPFVEGHVKEKNIHWLKPKLVGQFQFTEWTNDNKLRHPSFMGLRDDKDPREVKKEEV